ncbi:hypothetical protein FG386_001730 [Cryptosporidium ryanae]|uniref:uncharacterized protein n=1 Tax=Cryptosporidium ryanae TaxID=515981 RepID=UPI003519F75B|nr:hypothetical protein FG386_001730 [Cryptosporidium ryanae]
MNNGIRFKNDIIEELKSSNIPLSIILGATNRSPPGININKRKSIDNSEISDDCDSSCLNKNTIKKREDEYVSYNKGSNIYDDNYYINSSNYNEANSSVTGLGYDKSTSLNLQVLDSLSSSKSKKIPKFKLPIYDTSYKKVNSLTNSEVNDDCLTLNGNEYPNFKDDVVNSDKKVDYLNYHYVFDDTGYKLTEQNELKTSIIDDNNGNFYLSRDNQDKKLIEEINKENTELAMNIIKEISIGCSKFGDRDDEFKVADNNVEEISLEYNTVIENKDFAFHKKYRDVIYEYENYSYKLFNKSKFSDVKIAESVSNMKITEGGQDIIKNKINISNIDRYIPISSSNCKVIPVGEYEDKGIKIEEIIEVKNSESDKNSVNSDINYCVEYNNVYTTDNVYSNDNSDVRDTDGLNIDVDIMNNRDNEIDVTKIYVNKYKNNHNYSIFKNEEEFNELFDKLWIEAGEEIRENKGNSMNGELLNPVPFRSDLLEVSSKRKIKTTIPPIKELGGCSNNKINPIGLLRSLKNKSSSTNNDNYYKANTCYGKEAINNYKEEMSTRAPSTFLSNNELTTCEPNKTFSLSSSNIVSTKISNTEVDYPTFIFTKNNNNNRIGRSSQFGVNINEYKSCNSDVISNKQILLDELNDSKINKFESFLVIKDEYYENNYSNLNEYDQKQNASVNDIVEKKSDSYQISMDQFEKEDTTRTKDIEVDSCITKLDLERYDYGFSIDSIKKIKDTENIYDNGNEKINYDKDNDKSDNFYGLDKENHIDDKSNTLTSSKSSFIEDEDPHLTLKKTNVETNEEENVSSTRIMNSSVFTEKYRNSFMAFDIKKLFLSPKVEFNYGTKVTPRDEYEEKYDWSESIRYYKNRVFPIIKNKRVKLSAISSLILILFLLFNIVIPLLVMKVVNYKNIKTRIASHMFLVLTNPLLNYASLYLVNCIIFNITIKRVISFSQLFFNDYVNYLNRIANLDGENGEDLNTYEDVMTSVFNEALNLYIDSIVYERKRLKSELSKIIFFSDFMGVIQVTLITAIVLVFSLNLFSIDAENSISNSIRLLLLSSFQNILCWSLLIAYIAYKTNKKWELAEFLSLSAEGDSSRFSLFENYIENHIKARQMQFLTFTSWITEFLLFKNHLNNISIKKDSLNISLYEMEQHLRKYKKGTKDAIRDTKILSRIHISVKECCNDIWQYAFIHYNSTQKTIYISDFSFKKNRNAQGFTESLTIPTKMISIEYIKCTDTPWLYIYNETNFSLNADYTDGIIDYLFNKQFLVKNSKSVKNERFKWNIKNLINSFNSIQLLYHNNEGEQTYSDGKSDNQCVYILNCNFPREFIDEKRNCINYISGEFVKLQIMCFSFADLINIYRVLN